MKPHSTHADEKTSQHYADYDPLVFTRNMTEALFRMQQLTKDAVSQHSDQAMKTPFDPLNATQAFSEFYTKLLHDPGKLIDQQQKWMQDYTELMGYATRKWLGDDQAEPVVPPGQDKRFKADDWQQHAMFDVVRQSYLLTSNWLYDVIEKTDGVDPKAAQKVQFYTRQFLDALSPSNFVMTNPEVLQTTLENNGENLLKGLTQLESDLKHGAISMTDYHAFEVGRNLATTPGYVVYQNELMELIQYSPTTKQVYEVPVLMIPAWINKYYILDLQEKNSFVKWLTDQGYTVFVISWANPDAALANKTFEDYMTLGPLAAMDVIGERCGTSQLHALGYCLGGTLLATTLAWLHARGGADRVASATYLTTMIDFSEAGDLSVFVDEEQVEQLEARMQGKGYLEGREMAATFNLLRSNDLIWSFVVNHYLLGKEPFPFDLLYWNSDATRMPHAMHSFYMRNMYLYNKLAQPGGISVCGMPIDVRDITTPSFILSTREDHIAPWRSTYQATDLYQGPVEFVLAASGHVAGVINPPVKDKYCYWSAGGQHPESPDAWLQSAEETPGSWWPHWERWLQTRSGKQIAARQFSAADQKKYISAPGNYVKIKS